jgi:excisionase family DNA binding protein
MTPAKSSALPTKATYRVSEVADYYGVDERTVRRWIKSGDLSVIYTPSGARRVTRDSLDLCQFLPKQARPS